VFRFVFLVLHTPTTVGEAAQERFSEGIYVYSSAADSKAQLDSQNPMNIATQVYIVNPERRGSPFSLNELDDQSRLWTPGLSVRREGAGLATPAKRH
jgi:hypothetical protein